MAYSDNISRLSRLTAILVKLQSGRYVSAGELAKQFEVSKRTIYRDLKSLEEAGIPLSVEEGKGFSLVDGFNLPPVMFTEAEANALIFGEKMIDRTRDSSLILEFRKAADKVRSVLSEEDRKKAEFLAGRTIIGKNWKNERTSNFLSEVQKALTNFQVLQLAYLKENDAEPSYRDVEPFAIYHNTSEQWVLIAWCRLRKDFRSFRIDRIIRLHNTGDCFEPHEMTLDEYVEIQRKKHFQEGVT